MVIYKITNKINQKIYIGQSVNFHQRMRGHKSDAFNENSKTYNLPIYKAIRKYGWENFEKEIIDESPEDLDEKEAAEWANQKEIEYIAFYNSTIKGNGYNVSPGGGQSPQGKLTFEQRAKSSTIFTIEEVVDIQTLLQNGAELKDILEKYAPKLKKSFLENINVGINFYNPDLKYPLFDYIHSGRDRRFTPEEQKEIKEDIASGKTYEDIRKKWGLTIGQIANINNGKAWIEKDRQYPIIIKGNSRLHNWNDWVRPMLEDLEHSTLTLAEIAEKYKKAYSTVKKINEGFSYRDESKKYPLVKNRK